MLRRLLPLLLLVVLSGCDETPAGRSQLALVPGFVMSDMGRQAFDQLRHELPLDQDVSRKALVQCISAALIKSARLEYPEVETPEDWQVVIFDSPSPNAFALPGGRIGVNTGLFEVAQSPDQLAAVIAHEIAHVLAQHGNERLTQQLGIKAVLLVVGLISEGDVGQEPLMEALGIGSQLGIALPFSRVHESEADLMGLAIMARAGFDPGASITLWRNMAALGGSQPPEILSTHPGHQSRISGLREHMAAAKRQYQEAVPSRCSARPL
ncbi:M48 family metallopeptidase [Halomonas denitrificans]|uniref:M48 family metallopeptidase n=1 Tax=Halomonas denitrificans TaxID=370769 RepID=UPI001C99501A|nr:M48 family metallopeptidase [Halomonas denitrificans]MBY5969748.1 M48 family metallopeptidase [Halomonas denitrificans]